MTRENETNETNETNKEIWSQGDIAAMYASECIYFMEKYRITKQLMEKGTSPETIREREKNRDYDEALFFHLDECLKKCDDKTQLIIRKEFLEECPKKWYKPYFKGTTYYYWKRKAFKQFIDISGLSFIPDDVQPKRKAVKKPS
jgi:hypothetical protein